MLFLMGIAVPVSGVKAENKLRIMALEQTSDILVNRWGWEGFADGEMEAGYLGVHKLVMSDLEVLWFQSCPWTA